MKTSDVEKQRETLGVKECLVRTNLDMSFTGYQNRIGCTCVLFQHESHKPITHNHILETLILVMTPPTTY